MYDGGPIGLCNAAENSLSPPDALASQPLVQGTPHASVGVLAQANALHCQLCGNVTHTVMLGA